MPKLTITMHDDVLKSAKARAKSEGRSFSEHISFLVMQELGVGTDPVSAAAPDQEQATS